MTLPQRLLSIDVFRAVTMFLMIFVNDVNGVDNIPSWIKHVPAGADGLGFADVIFPGFLFIIGLSVPFAIKNRMKKGQSFFELLVYIVLRSFALIVMGFFHVNLENYSNAALIPREVWQILLTVSFFLIWLDYPATLSKARKYGLIAAGILLLAGLAYTYSGGSSESPEGLKPSWWGILGILGWTYLVCATVFLIAKGKLTPLFIVFCIFMLINIASHTGLLTFSLQLIGDASSVSLTMAGTVASVLYAYLVSKEKAKQLWVALIIAGVVMLFFGNLIRPFAEGISKIRSTPAWVAICIGISTLGFVASIYLIDVKRKQHWFRSIKTAGTSTLTCYLIPYLIYPLFVLVNFHYPPYLNSGLSGVVRSLVFAFIVIQIAALLERYKIRLRV